MDGFVRTFIRSSLVWLAIGGAIGLCMAIWPFHALAYKPAHVHANMLGFVSMMIFGVAYHVLPRFSGRGLYSMRFARAHLVLANAGLGGMVGGFIVRVTWAPFGNILVAGGGVLSAAGMILFIINIWKTIEPASRPFVMPGNSTGRPN